MQIFWKNLQAFLCDFGAILGAIILYYEGRFSTTIALAFRSVPQLLLIRFASSMAFWKGIFFKAYNILEYWKLAQKSAWPHPITLTGKNKYTGNRLTGYSPVPVTGIRIPHRLTGIPPKIPVTGNKKSKPVAKNTPKIRPCNVQQ